MLMTSLGMPLLDQSGSAIVVNSSGGPLSIRSNGAVIQDGFEAGTIGLFNIKADSKVQRLSPLVIRANGVEDAGVVEREASVHQGFLETSNVNPMAELTRLLTAQRLFQGATTMMETCEATYNEAIRTLASAT